jgi:A/G-specific adenine glycosylase
LDWFATRLLSWFHENGRKDLPWQNLVNPYRVWVSEIMLQQTQVNTVIPFYRRFMTHFPTVRDLAAADLDEALHHWTGLGYYARGRNLHKAAQAIVTEHGGDFPVGVDALTRLPGIGRSTAGAIAAISQGIAAPILDGNVKRVLARFHEVAGHSGEAGTRKTLWAHAEAHTPAQRAADYTQAIMDLGATVCSRQPRCGACPVQTRCRAHRHGTTDRFPERKPKQARPVRTARMFLITGSDNACLLERRPANGIWGGLWTPPARDSSYSVTDLANEFGLAERDMDAVASAPAFRHTFTHFYLDIEPVHVQLKRALQLARDHERLLWYTPGSSARVGLAAPVVTLLDALAGEPEPT